MSKPIVCDRCAIGSLIKKFRKEKGYHQKEIAGFLGITQPNYSHIEKGKIALKVEHLSKLAHHFEKELSDFFPEDSTPSLSYL